MAELTGARFTNIFATPLIAHVWSDGAELNPQLADHIFAHERQSPGVTKTNAGGWHSETGQLEFCGEPGAPARPTHVRDRRRGDAAGPDGVPPAASADAVDIVGLGQRQPRRRIDPHSHPSRRDLRGTDYVDPGEPPEDAENGTPIHSFDPCQGRSNVFLPPLVPTHFLITPEPGLMILFPSYVPAPGLLDKGGRPRISIAFNMRKEPFP